MPYTIREATTADARVLAHQRELMFRDMGTECDYPAMVDACARWYAEALPAQVFKGWLIEDTQGEVVGGGGLIVMPWSPGPTRLDPRMAWVINVWVEPAHRGHHLARQLMDRMHAWCREHGVERVGLNATQAGAPTYRVLGYHALSEPMMRLDL